MRVAIPHILAAVIALTVTGCATVLNDKNQNVNIVTSTGQKADIVVDGQPVQAPAVALLRRSKSDQLITTRDPKCNQTTIASSSLDNVFFINLLSGYSSTSGSTTDFATGEMWKYQDNVVISCKD